MPKVYEAVGIYRKRLPKAPPRNRPPSAQGKPRDKGITIEIEEVSYTSVLKPEDFLADPTIEKPAESKPGTRLGTSDTLDLTAISQSLQDSLANLSQVNRFGRPKNEIVKQLNRKLSFKKKIAADNLASVEQSVDSTSGKASAQMSDKKPRFQPLKPIGMNRNLKAKIGEDVFLKSIFGNKIRNNSDNAYSPEHSVEYGSDPSVPSDAKGANGARLRLVRNILVPVACR